MTAEPDKGCREGGGAAGAVMGAGALRGGVSGERNGLEAAKSTADLLWAKATWIRRYSTAVHFLQSIHAAHTRLHSCKDAQNRLLGGTRTASHVPSSS